MPRWRPCRIRTQIPWFLAKIAYENPEFGANVVANPRAYPGLKRWVAQFGDERARQQLVAMGWPVPQDGIMQQEAETASEQAQYQMPQQSSEVQYQAQYQPPATQQCQPEPFAATPAIKYGERCFDGIRRPIYQPRRPV